MGAKVSKEQLKELKHSAANLVDAVVNLSMVQDEFLETSKWLDNLIASLESQGDGPNILEECKNARIKLLTTEESTRCRREKAVTVLNNFFQYMRNTVRKEIGYQPGDFNESLFEEFKNKRSIQHPSREQRHVDMMIQENKSLKKKVEFLDTNVKELQTKIALLEIEKNNLEEQTADREFELMEWKAITKNEIMDVEKQMKEVHKLNITDLNKEISDLSKTLTTMKRQEKKLDDYLQLYVLAEKANNAGPFSGNNCLSMPIFQNDLSCQQSNDLEHAINEGDNAFQTNPSDTMLLEETTENVGFSDGTCVSLQKSAKRVDHTTEHLNLTGTDTKNCSGLKSELCKDAPLLQVIVQKNTELRSCQDELRQIDVQFHQTFSRFQNDLKCLQQKYTCMNEQKKKRERDIDYEKVCERMQETESDLIKNLKDAIAPVLSLGEKSFNLCEKDRVTENQHFDDLTEQLRAILTVCNKFTKDKEELLKEISEIRNTMQKQKTDIRDIIQNKDVQLSNLETKQRESDKRIEQLNDKIAKTEEKHKKEISDYENKVKETEFDYNIEKEKNGFLERTIQDKTDQFKKLHEQCEREKSIHVGEREKERNKIEELNCQYTKKVDELAKVIRGKESLLVKLTQLTLTMSDQNKAHDNDLYSEDEIISKLQEELNTGKERNRLLQSKLTSDELEYNNKRKELECKLKVEHEKYQMSEKVIEEKKQELDGWHKKLEGITMISLKYSEDSAAIIRERNSEKERREELENQLKKVSSKCKNLSNDKEVCFGQIRSLESTMKQEEIKYQTNIENKDEQIAGLNKTLKDQADKIKELSMEKEKAQTEHDDKEKQMVLHLEQEKKKFEILSEKVKLKDDSLLERENKIRLLKHEKDSLITVRDDKENQIMRHNEALKRNTERINTLEEQNESQKNDFETKLAELNNKEERLERQMEMLRKDSNAKLQKEILEKQTLEHNLRDTEESFKEKMKNFEEEKENFKKDIKKQETAHADEKNVLTQKVKTLREKVQSTDNNMKTLLAQIEKDTQERKKEINQLHSEKASLIRDLDILTATNEKIRKELETIKSRKMIQVQLYCQSGVGLLSSVENELKVELRSKFDVEESVDMDIIDCAKPSDINSDIPLLILCIQASRLGTAVTTTVQGLNLTQKMAVLIFHHKDIHALPSQASDRVLTQPELRNLGGIFDLAFLSGKGMYECDMNRVNFISLTNFIKREGTKRLKDDL